MTLQELIVVVGADVGGFVDGMDTAISKASATQSSLGSVGEAIPAGVVQPLNSVADAAAQAGASTEAMAGKMAGAIEALTAEFPDLTSAVSGYNAATEKAVPVSEQLDQVIKKLTDDSQPAADNLNQAGQATQGFNLNIGSLIKTFGALTGVQLTLQGLKAAVVETFTAFAQLQRATESLTALTGSAKLANDAIAQMRTLAQDEALSFPSLLKDEQQMTAFGISTKNSTALLALAGDASVATGRAFDSVVASVQRIIESGNASAKALQGVGIESRDLASVMGVTSGEAAKLFKALDQSAQIDILLAAMARFKGIAKDTSNDLTGSWQQLSNAANAEFSRIGKELSDTGQAFTAFGKGAISALGSVADFVINFGKGISSTFADISNAIKNAAAGWGVTFQDYAAAAAKAAASNQTFEQSTGTLIIAARQLFAPFPEYKTQFETLLSQFQKDGDVSAFTSKVLVLEGQFKSLNPTVGAAATSTGTYTQEVAKLKKQLDDGVITQTTYNQKLKELEAQHGATSKAAKDHAASIESLTQKMADAQKSATAAQTLLDSIRAKYEAGTASVNLLAEAHRQLDSIIQKANGGIQNATQIEQGLIDKQAVLTQEAKNAAQAYINLYQQYETGDPILQKALDGAVKALNAVGLDLDDIGIKSGKMSIQILQGGKDVTKAAGDMATQLESAAKQVAGISDGIQVLNGHKSVFMDIGTAGMKAFSDIGTAATAAFSTIDKSTSDTASGFTVLGGSASGVAKVIESWKPGIDTFAKGLEDDDSIITDSLIPHASAMADGIQVIVAGTKSERDALNEANAAHQALNDTAAKLPQILNADATTLEQVSALIVDANSSMSDLAGEAKSVATDLSNAASASSDISGFGGKFGGGGTLIPGAHYGGGSVNPYSGQDISRVGTVETFTGTPFGPIGSPFNPAPTPTTPASAAPTSVPPATQDFYNQNLQSSAQLVTAAQQTNQTNSGIYDTSKMSLSEISNLLSELQAQGLSLTDAAAELGGTVSTTSAAITSAVDSTTTTAAAGFSRVVDGLSSINDSVLAGSSVSTSVAAQNAAVAKMAPPPGPVPLPPVPVVQSVDPSFGPGSAPSDAEVQAHYQAVFGNRSPISGVPSIFDSSIPQGTFPRTMLPSFPQPQAYVPPAGSMQSGNTVIINHPVVNSRSMLDQLKQELSDLNIGT